MWDIATSLLNYWNITTRNDFFTFLWIYGAIQKKNSSQLVAHTKTITYGKCLMVGSMHSSEYRSLDLLRTVCLPPGSIKLNFDSWEKITLVQLSAVPSRCSLSHVNIFFFINEERSDFFAGRRACKRTTLSRRWTLRVLMSLAHHSFNSFLISLAATKRFLSELDLVVLSFLLVFYFQVSSLYFPSS